MAIAAEDLVMYFSMGSNITTAASSAAMSYGGNISSTAITDASPNNLFDDVDSNQAGNGATEYRCIMLKNDTLGGLSLENAKVWQETESASTQTTTSIGLATGATNSDVAASPGDEITAPNIMPANTVPVDFQPHTTVGAALTLGTGTLAPGEWVAIWIRRVVDVGAAAFPNDNFTIRFQGDTLP